MTEPTEQPVVDDQVGEATTGLSAERERRPDPDIPVSPTPAPRETAEED